jgi:hypothetical protein
MIPTVGYRRSSAGSSCELYSAHRFVSTISSKNSDHRVEHLSGALSNRPVGAEESTLFQVRLVA